MSDKIEVRVSCRCESSADQVFDAWLDAGKARHWLAASLREAGLAGDIRRVEIDARVGGRFLFTDLRGEVEARHWGTYLELERPHRIVFTWIVDESEEADPSRVTLTITPDGAGCRAGIVHEMDAAWIDYAGQTEAGWGRMLRACDKPASGR